MRIMLVNPPASQPIFSTGPTYLPLGLAYIAGSLRQAGHRIHVLDMTVGDSSEDRFLRAVETIQPEWIGFTAVTPNVRSAYRLCRTLKSHKKLPVVMGGPHVTSLPEEALCEGIDVVVRGEGEQTVLALCDRLQTPWEVPGVSCMKNGKPFHSEDRDLLEDLDGLPFPARDLFPDLIHYTGQPVLGNQTPVGTLVTSRGCPYNCSFCYKAMTGRTFRTRSPENVLEEWQRLIHEHGVAEIAICDDAFTLKEDRVLELCQRLIEAKLTVPWSCPNGIRADPLSREMLLAMKKAGCYRTAIGVESGDERILERVNKGLSLDHIRRAFDLCKEVGIQTTAFLMLGNPGENRGTMEKTIAFAKEIEPDFAQFLIATPYPGTRLRKDVLTEGKLLVKDWDLYGSYESRVYFEMEDCPPALVLEMQKRAYRSFYLRPSYILKRLRFWHTYRFLFRSIRGLWNFVLHPN